MSVARFAFGPRLKAHRERQGITLQDIGDSTKIGVTLLASLERNDVSQWPKGIFRRAFLRSYTRAIDIPFEPVWTEFSQLFPEEGQLTQPAAVAGGTPLRLTLEGSSRPFVTPSRRHLMAAGIDNGIVIVLGVIGARVSGVNVWACMALLALVYLAGSTLFAGGSLTLWYLRVSRSRATAAADHVPIIERLRETATGPMGIVSDGFEDSASARPKIFALSSTHAVVSASTEAPERSVAGSRQ